MTRHILRSVFGLALSSLLFQVAWAQPANVWQVKDCFSGNATGRATKLNITSVYAQILNKGTSNAHLNLTLLGQSGQEILGVGGGNLATLFTTSEILTFEIWQNRTSFCDTLRPPSPLNYSAFDPTTQYCPIPKGPFALSSYIPLASSYELATIVTELRAVDPYASEILCVQVSTTPLDPGVAGSVYGKAVYIMWESIVLAAAYWVVVGIARITGALDRAQGRAKGGLWSRVENIGYVIASAISGERFASSPALMRFCTPSMRDIFFHTQWCAALAMVAVQWPRYVYPLLAQTAWASLAYNVTLTQQDSSSRWNPLTVPPYNPPSSFSDQMNNKSSVLFVDQATPNTLFMLPNNTPTGIASFAYTVGVRPQDLFGICLSLFLSLVAGAVAISVVVWVLDWLGSLALRRNGRTPARAGARSPGPRYASASASKDALDAMGNTEEDRSSSAGHFLFRRLPPAGMGWKRRLLRSGPNSFHGSVLHGNIVRLIILFHFPITIFSSYQMTQSQQHVSLTSIVLAALSFAVLSVLVPALLVFRLVSTSTNKLYDETGTLLSLGPLYNHYRHGSQLFATIFFATNVAFGVTIGCGQSSGTAQAIVILVVEVASALGTSIWLPWGHGASMGLISFLFCVARIVIAVLLVILTPVVSIGQDASGWVALAILFILGLIYLTLALLLLVKLVEAVVRLVGGVGFNRSRHGMDTGLIGACGLLGCCGGRRRRRASRSQQRQRASVPPRETEDHSFTLPSGSTTKQLSGPPSVTTGPPSVLRPEHAMRPYKEDSDDEGGYIMRAWQPFPRPGYTPVDELPPTEPTSGFTRVGGGRATYDTPYAITTGGSTTQTYGAKSIDQYPQPSFRGESPPPTASLTNVARHVMPVNPPGAFSSHNRRHSQTAIIEDAFDPSASRHAVEPSSADSEAFGDGDESDGADTPKRKWFGLRRNKRASDILPPTSPVPPATDPSPADAGRSFVVVRKKPASSPSVNGPASMDVDESGRRSFTVLRNEVPGSSSQ